MQHASERTLWDIDIDPLNIGKGGNPQQTFVGIENVIWDKEWSQKTKNSRHNLRQRNDTHLIGDLKKCSRIQVVRDHNMSYLRNMLW